MSSTPHSRSMFSALTFAAALAVGLATFQSSASADLFSKCPSHSGSMRFWDAGTDHCGYVSGWNANWGNLPGGWNDRADQFGNDGTTHSVCIYQNANYGGADVLLPRTYFVEWSNIVSSNSWTTASSCP